MNNVYRKKANAQIKLIAVYNNFFVASIVRKYDVIPPAVNQATARLLQKSANILSCPLVNFTISSY